MYYAGIDAHARYLHVVVLDKDGSVICEGVVQTAEPAAIREYLSRFRPLRVVMESSGFWPWLRDQLEEDGVEFRLAHARELRAIAMHAQKNDAADAHLLARMLLANLIPPAHAPATASLEMVRLVRHYAWLTRYRTMFANRIHGQLHQSGIQLRRELLLTRTGKQTLSGLAPRLSAEQKRVIRTHLLMIACTTRLLSALRAQIRRQAQQNETALLLQSIPGVGCYWSLVLSAHLQPVERFRSADHLVSYAGLAPITRASGGHVSHGPLPQAANRWVRGALVAATMSHVRHAPQSSLSQYYMTTKARLGWKKARVASARKLARAVYRILRSQRAWQS